MRFTLQYALDFGLGRSSHARVFASREAALEYALRLYCYGYELFALAGENGETLDAEQILENAHRLPLSTRAA